jgi:Holliday junction resolvase RusA-like endonuclease
VEEQKMPVKGSVYVEMREIETGRGFSLTLPYPPRSGNHQHGHRGKAVFLQPEVIQWRAEVRAIGDLQLGRKWKPLYGPLRAMYVITYPDKRKRDRGNVEKVVDDALQPWAIIDDCQIVEWKGRRR